MNWDFLDTFDLRHLPPQRWDSVNEFVEAFRGIPQPELAWTAVDGIVSAAKAAASQRQEILEKRLRRSDADFEFFGGDPSRFDWSEFRPLRLSREEDWSDWLGHLIETSEVGRFTHQILGAEGLSRPRVEREVSCLDGARRADLVVVGERRSLTIEVKLLDDGFDKTLETALAIEALLSGQTWTHAILLPERRLPHWERTASTESVSSIRTVTWEQVAQALRRQAIDNNSPESTAWRVWAATFAGAIEQTILGFPRLARGANPALSLVAIENWIRALGG